MEVWLNEILKLVHEAGIFQFCAKNKKKSHTYLLFINSEFN